VVGGGGEWGLCGGGVVGVCVLMWDCVGCVCVCVHVRARVCVCVCR